MTRALLVLASVLVLGACAASGPRPQDVRACWDFYSERVEADALRALCSWDGAYPTEERGEEV